MGLERGGGGGGKGWFAGTEATREGSALDLHGLHKDWMSNHVQPRPAWQSTTTPKPLPI